MSQFVHIIDDEESIRDSLSFLFSSAGIQSVTWAGGEAFLEGLPHPDCACIILDVRMHGLSGPEVFERLRESGCNARVIFLTGHADVPVAVSTLKAGAFDFLEKPFNDNQIVELVRNAFQYHAADEAINSSHREIEERLSTLSAREKDVMCEMLDGKLNKQIADSLGIAMRTVEVHRSRVLSKLKARNVAELAKLLKVSSA